MFSTTIIHNIINLSIVYLFFILIYVPVILLSIVSINYENKEKVNIQYKIKEIKNNIEIINNNYKSFCDNKDNKLKLETNKENNSYKNNFKIIAKHFENEFQMLQNNLNNKKLRIQDNIREIIFMKELDVNKI